MAKQYCIVCGREIKSDLMWPALVRDSDGSWYLVYAHVPCGLKVEARDEELRRAALPAKPAQITGA